MWLSHLLVTLVSSDLLQEWLSQRQRTQGLSPCFSDSAPTLA